MKQLMKTDKSGIMKIPPKGKVDFGEMLLREQLFKKGIEKNRLQAIGHGQSRPVDSNDTDEGRANNRRTEFEIIKN